MTAVKKTIRDNRPWAKGIVVSHSGGAGAYYVVCKIDGEDTARTVNIPCLSTYTPVDTDRVLLARCDANDYIALDKIPT